MCPVLLVLVLWVGEEDEASCRVDLKVGEACSVTEAELTMARNPK